MSDVRVKKPGPDRKKIWEDRHPVPETLFGDVASAMASLEITNAQNKYCSGVMSFHLDDICVDEFNGGDPAV